MTRKSWMIAALACCACGPSRRSADLLLPASVGVWQRKDLRETPPAQPGVVRAFAASYEGSGKLTVELYEAKVSGTAFEMTQHWRALPDTVVFDKGRYFVVLKWQQSDRLALSAFVRALQANLKE